jgi:gluconokinase
MKPKGFLIMGVAGSGKSTLGKPLAQKLGWDFFDADEYHSAENIAKMTAGVPLADSDRIPWLAALNQQLVSTLKANRHPILACSALKDKYRTLLLDGLEEMAVIYLKGSYDDIWYRLVSRQGHYMKENMLQGQFLALEEPDDALVLDVSLPVEDMLERIFTKYFLLER